MTATKLQASEIVTFSGEVIDPMNPQIHLIHIEDIAHSLSNQCRFTGHTKSFYSVAQHSVLVSEIVSFENSLWGLLHDASEAYLADLARPIKHQGGLGEIYREAEENLNRAIALTFGLEWPMPADVKWADNVLLRTEARDLMPEAIDGGMDMSGDFLDYEIDESWTPPFAKYLFLERFKDLTKEGLK